MSTSITYNANVESLLARHLKIRFIDARTLATEAKLNLGINGYVSNSEDIERVYLESVKIFNDRTANDKHAMHALKNTLDTIKRSSFADSSCSRSRSSMMSTASSISSDEGDDEDEDDGNNEKADDASFTMKSITKRFSFGSTSNKKKGSSKLRRSLTNKGAQVPLQKKEVPAAA